MFVIRAAFWLALVSAFVPYKQFDLAKGEFRVDYKALNHQFHALIHVCETKPEVCVAAGDLVHVAREEAAHMDAYLRDLTGNRR